MGIGRQVEHRCSEWLTEELDGPIIPSPLFPTYQQTDGDRKFNGEQPRIQIAPMLNVTDRHFRHFFRLLTRRSQLWTEMIVDKVALFSPLPQEHLGFSAVERPCVLQLGGSDEKLLGCAARFCSEWNRTENTSGKFGKLPGRYGVEPGSTHNFWVGSNLVKGKAVYDEINVNVGCPSDKVAGKGQFGASLMKDPKRVAAIVQRMLRVTGGVIPVTVKCRVGVDELDSYTDLVNFVRTVSELGGVRHFIIHARKAWLKGLNPKANRTKPELRYDFVFKLVRQFPRLRFSINGGVDDMSSVKRLLTLDAREVSGEEPKNLLARVRDNEASTSAPESTEPTPLPEVPEQENILYDELKLSLPHADVLLEDQRLDTLDVLVGGATPYEVDELPESYTLFGVMLGRLAMNNPCAFAKCDSTFYGDEDPKTARSRRNLLQGFALYLAETFPDRSLIKSSYRFVKAAAPVLHGMPGNRLWRRLLAQSASQKDVTPSQVITNAIAVVDQQYPSILDYPIGEEPANTVMTTMVKIQLGTWVDQSQAGAKRPSRSDISEEAEKRVNN